MSRTSYQGSEVVRETLFTTTPTGTVDFQYRLGPGAWLITLFVQMNAVAGSAVLGAALVNAAGTALFPAGLITLTNATAVASTATAGAALASLNGCIFLSPTTAGTTGAANNMPIAVYQDIAFRYIAGTTTPGSAAQIDMVAVRVG